MKQAGEIARQQVNASMKCLNRTTTTKKRSRDVTAETKWAAEIYELVAVLYSKTEILRVWGDLTPALGTLFSDITRDELARGWRRARDAGGTFAPKPGEFRVWCKEAPPRSRFFPAVPRIAETEEQRARRVAEQYAAVKPAIDECRRVLGL